MQSVLSYQDFRDERCEEGPCVPREVAEGKPSAAEGGRVELWSVHVQYLQEKCTIYLKNDIVNIYFMSIS